MLLTNQKPTGIRYTNTVTLLVTALVVVPALLILSSPFGTAVGLTAMAASVMCLGLASLSWRHSNLTTPSIEAPPSALIPAHRRTAI